MRISDLENRLATLRRKNGNLECKTYVGEGEGMLDNFLMGRFTHEDGTDYLMIISDHDRLNLESTAPGGIDEVQQKDL